MTRMLRIAAVLAALAAMAFVPAAVAGHGKTIKVRGECCDGGSTAITGDLRGTWAWTDDGFGLFLSSLEYDQKHGIMRFEVTEVFEGRSRGEPGSSTPAPREFSASSRGHRSTTSARSRATKTARPAIPTSGSAARAARRSSPAPMSSPGRPGRSAGTASSSSRSRPTRARSSSRRDAAMHVSAGRRPLPGLVHFVSLSTMMPRWPTRPTPAPRVRSLATRSSSYSDAAGWGRCIAPSTRGSSGQSP